MKCQTIERLILESEERSLGEGERRMIEEHLAGCARCRAFQAGRRKILEGLRTLRPAELPPSLGRRTKELCLKELRGLEAGARPATEKAKVPIPVIAASVVFTLLAAVWLTASLLDVTPGQPLPSAAWGAVVFIAQNVLMLFLSPVILRARRPSGGEWPLYR
jgi:hypothetical protein